MKKKAILWIAVCALAAIAIGTAVFFWVNSSQKPTLENDEFTYSVYFLNKTKDSLAEEFRQYDMPNDNIAYQLITELLAGPADTENHVRAFPENVQLLNIQTNNGSATVNFSKELGEISENETLLAAYTVVKTLTQSGIAREIVINIDGEPLTDSSGNPRDPFAAEDIVIGSTAQMPAGTVMKLYFYDENAEYLKAENRIISVSGNISIEQCIIEELIKGPASTDLIPTLTPDSKLLSVQTEDKTCFVNFSSDFISKNTGGSTKESGVIYSIVNSLTELDGINQVQFLIEGKKTDSFGSFAFNEPFERDEARIAE